MTNYNYSEFLASHEREVQTAVESRLVDKHFEQFEYAFEDIVIDLIPTLAPAGEDDEDDETRMNIIYEVMHRAIKERYNLKSK